MKRSIILFVICSFAFSWFAWGIGYLVVESYIDIPVNSELFMIIGRFGPSVVGTIFLIKEVRFRAIIANTFLIRTPWWNIMLIFGLMPVLFGGTYVLLLLFGQGEYITTLLNEPLTILLVYVYVLLLGGPVAEEIGWRGFMTSELVKNVRPIYAALVIGFIWSTWHLPLFFIPGNVQESIPIVIYYLYTIILAIIMMVLILRTKQISSAVYFHTSANVSIGVFYILDSVMGLYVIGTLLIVVTSILVYKNYSLLIEKQVLTLKGFQEME